MTSLFSKATCTNSFGVLISLLLIDTLLVSCFSINAFTQSKEKSERAGYHQKRDENLSTEHHQKRTRHNAEGAKSKKMMAAEGKRDHEQIQNYEKKCTTYRLHGI